MYGKYEIFNMHTKYIKESIKELGSFKYLSAVLFVNLSGVYTVLLY